MFHYEYRKSGLIDCILDEFQRDDCEHKDDYSQHIDHLNQTKQQPGDFSGNAENTDLLEVVECTDHQLYHDFGHCKNDEELHHVIKSICSVGKVRKNGIIIRLCYSQI